MPTKSQAIFTPTEAITNNLTHLVKMPTISSDQSTNQAALDWVEEQLKDLPLHIRRYQHNGSPSLVATTRPTRQPRLWLVGHIDIVPAPAASFTPLIKHGRFHGAGAHDMKCGIAVFMTLLQNLGSDLPQYDLGLMLTADEELGGYDGVRWLLDKQGYRGHAALIADSGASWHLEIGSKGVMWWELQATGHSAHASRPWEGVNAIEQIVKFVDILHTNVPTEPCGDPAHKHTTINLAYLNGGSATNKVAESATARLDIRVNPTNTPAEVTAWVKAAEVAMPTVSAQPLMNDAPYVVKDQTPVELFQSIAKDLTGRVLTAGIAHGSSDARHFAALGIATVNASPEGSGFHLPNEWVSIKGLTEYYDITRRFIEKIAKR